MEEKVFNNLEEMEKYYNEQTNTYVFKENYEYMDIEINFELRIDSNIKANNIDASDINALNINAHNIKAWVIVANNIKANNIEAYKIKANDISFYAFCITASKLECTSIKGMRINHIYKCLDNDIVFKPKQYTKVELVEILGHDFEIVG